LQAVDAGFRPHGQLMQKLEARTDPWLARATRSLGRRLTFKA